MTRTTPVPPAAAAADAPCPVYQLKITLAGIKPAIWRRVLVSGGCTLQALHQIIQGVLGWSDSHLHQFEIGDQLYSAPDPLSPDADELGDVFLSEQATVLAEVLPEEGARFGYLYDYGDQWEHRIVVEKIVTLPPGQIPEQRLPACIAGAGARPPEDCGGPPGYRDLLRLHQGEQPAETSASDGESSSDDIPLALPKGFAPEYFDLAQANAALAQIFHGGAEGVSERPLGAAADPVAQTIVNRT